MRIPVAAALALLSTSLPARAIAQEPPKAAAAPEAARPPEPAKPAPAAEAQKPAAPASPSPAELGRTVYGIGLIVSKSLEVFDLSPAELENVIRGVRDGLAGKAKAQLDPKLQQAVSDLARARAPRTAQKAAAREKAAGAPYLAKMAKEKGARRTASGAIVIPVAEGTGATPKETDKVKVNYTGKLVSGQVFDSNAGRTPVEFPVGGVIKCWTEGLQTMKVGGKARFVCPPDVAYGETGAGPVPPNAVLTFEVELVDVAK